jgi:hypothetical protein
MTDCANDLKKLIDEIESLKAIDSEHPRNNVWRGKVLRVVKKCFGEESDYTKEIEDVLNPTMVVSSNTPDSYWKETQLEMLERADAHLNAYLEDLGQNSKEANNDKSQDTASVEKMQTFETPLQKLEFLFKKFHPIVKSLARRHDNRGTLLVTDEYDVQDLLRSLMNLFFDDIRIEQWTPGFATKSVRMDFLLNKEQVVVECKFARHNHDEKKISDELIIDIARYTKHANCKKLVCLVYDPNGVIDNKSELCDLEDKSNTKLSVHIYVVP